MSLDATIARARSFAEARMTDRCTILELRRAEDGAGGSTTTWVPAQTDVQYYARPASRLRPSGSVEAVQGGRIQGSDEWIIDLPAGTPITAANRLQLTGGRILEVIHIEALNTVELFRSVACAEVR